MIIYRPGFKPVDDNASAPKVAAKSAPLPSVSEAMQAALARQTQVLGFTGPKADAPSKGLVDTSTGQSVSEPAPVIPPDPAVEPDPVEKSDEEIEAEATAILAALAAKKTARVPHSINGEVQK